MRVATRPGARSRTPKPKANLPFLLLGLQLNVTEDSVEFLDEEVSLEKAAEKENFKPAKRTKWGASTANIRGRVDSAAEKLQSDYRLVWDDGSGEISVLDSRDDEARHEADYEFLLSALDNGTSNIRAKLSTDGSPNSFKLIAAEDMKPDTVVGGETGELTSAKLVGTRCTDSTSGLYVTDINSELIPTFSESEFESASICLDSLEKGNQFRFLNDPLWSCEGITVPANVGSFLGIDKKHATLFVAYYTLSDVKKGEQLYVNWVVACW